MTDIVERLRELAIFDKDDANEAADEIERLRAKLKSLLAIGDPVWPTVRGCFVCGLGADGKPIAYACPRNDCPTKAMA